MKKNGWIFPYIRQNSGLFLLSLVLGSLTILSGAALMFTSGYLISKAATQPESILMVYVPIVGVRTFGIGRAVLSYIDRLMGHSLILKILSSMRVRLYKMIEPQALFIRSKFSSGDLLGILADDIDHLQDFFLKTLFPALVALLVYVVIIFAAGLLSIPFAIMLMILLGLLIFVSPLFSLLYMKAKNEQIKAGRNRLYRQVTETMFGISDWIFSDHYRRFIHDHEHQEQNLFELEKKKQRFMNQRDFFAQLILGITVIYAIYTANDFTSGGEVPATFIAAIALMMLSILESFLPISGAVSEATSYQESLRRLGDIQGEEIDVNVIESFEGPAINQPVSINITNLSYQYAEKNVLNHVHASMKQGEKIAIIGRSGAGKSTFLKLLYGALIPTGGEVTINGHRAHTLTSTMPDLIGVLNQKAYLFNTSVLNNIRLGHPEATDEEVYEVARMVQLDELIRTLPQGYHTNMQETGQRFSGGERQRIALARILLQSTPVVLLDEPTVGLDPITEAKLLATIFETLKEKTIIWVTHHLLGVNQMDRVLFLDNGEMIMEGTHEYLLEHEARYRHLYALDQPFARERLS